jgi:hypothetical protein
VEREEDVGSVVSRDYPMEVGQSHAIGAAARMVRPAEVAAQPVLGDPSVALSIGRYITGRAKGRDPGLGALVVAKLSLEKRVKSHRYLLKRRQPKPDYRALTQRAIGESLTAGHLGVLLLGDVVLPRRSP